MFAVCSQYSQTELFSCTWTQKLVRFVKSVQENLTCWSDGWRWQIKQVTLSSNWTVLLELWLKETLSGVPSSFNRLSGQISTTEGNHRKMSVLRASYLVFSQWPLVRLKPSSALLLLAFSLVCSWVNYPTKTRETFVWRPSALTFDTLRHIMHFYL